MTENIKQFIANLNITRVSYNMAYPLFEGKDVNKDTGDIVDSDSTDLCFTKVVPGTKVAIFLGGKTHSEWINYDRDSQYYVNTYFLDENFGLISTNNTALSNFSHNPKYLGKNYDIPDSCVYVLQSVKRGYQKYVVMTDLLMVNYTKADSVNMDYVWGQAVLNYNYETETLKPYSLPYHIREANVDDTIEYLDTSNTIYPLPILPNKKLKIKSDSKWAGEYSEYDKDMNLLRYEFPTYNNGYVYCETTRETKYIVFSYQNDNGLTPINFTIEYNGDVETPEEPQEVEHTIEIVNGIAKIDGNAVTKAYKNAIITVEALQIEGKTFKEWSSANAVFDNKYSESTQFVMPNENVHIEATYENINSEPEPTSGIMSTLNGYEIVDAKARKNISNRSVIAKDENELIAYLELGGIIELICGKTYTFTDTLTYHQDTTTIIGNGAILDFSSITEENKPAIRIISKNATDNSGLILGTLRKQALRYIEGCYIIGSNITPNYEGGRKGIGLLFEGDDNTLQNSAFLTIRNCVIAGFRAGCVHHNQSWCVLYDMCNINVCDKGITVSYGYRNYGEKIGIINSVINTCSFGIVSMHTYGTVQCVNTSLDYNFTAVKASNNGKVIISNSHIESTKDKGYFFDTDTNGVILVNNSVFYCQQSSYGLVNAKGNSKVILKNNLKEAYSLPSNVVETGCTVVDEWI